MKTQEIAKALTEFSKDESNYDKANQTGRKVYKRADQTYQVDGGKWMPV